jgi:hypothetical protein
LSYLDTYRGRKWSTTSRPWILLHVYLVRVRYVHYAITSLDTGKNIYRHRETFFKFHGFT